jgi:hypothetical protein
VFGVGGTGDSNTLYLHGGARPRGSRPVRTITAAASPTLDFSVTATPQSATVGRRGCPLYAHHYTGKWIRKHGSFDMCGADGRGLHTQSVDRNSRYRRCDRHHDSDDLGFAEARCSRQRDSHKACWYVPVWVLLCWCGEVAPRAVLPAAGVLHRHAYCRIAACFDRLRR